MARLLQALFGRTPLGWLQLAHHPLRFSMAITGVAFAVLMVFMQLGFMNMLFDTTVMFHRQLKADIVLVDPAARSLIDLRTFPRRRFIQAMGVEGIADGETMHIGQLTWIKPGTEGHGKGERGIITAFGIRTDHETFVTPGVSAEQGILSITGTALFDTGSRGDFRAFIEAIQAGQRPQTEVAGKTVTFEGVFRIGASFGSEGSIIVSDQTFLALSPKASPGLPNLGVLRVKTGADPTEVAHRVRAAVAGADVKVLTLEEFITESRNFLVKESPIAYIFTFGVIMGLVVGIVIVIQILSTDVQDHMPEYATFKALGFTNRSLLGIVYEQAAILTIAGFVPGLLVSLGLYELVRTGVSMPITMPPDRVLMVFAMTATMCVLAGTIAMRRLSRADPAEVF
ncbi:MAG: ABC transporter permease DevC [Beijerinckiaceae bacterium]|nr:ABC transporter permease DevC [Beijerinckiaceae bacterium]MCZ8301801.1 ABC transporter permease DevC [Beijerinckiaceae bacterium]